MLGGRQGLLKSGYRLRLSRSEFNVFALLPQTSFETLDKASSFTMPSSSEVSVRETITHLGKESFLYTCAESTIMRLQPELRPGEAIST